MPTTDPNTPPAALTDHVGYWLRLVSNQVSHTFAARLIPTGVTVAEWVVLRTLHDQAPIAPSVLAGQMQMTRGAISKLADRLIAKELIARTSDPTDKRAHILSLTPGGRRLVPKLAAIADANDAHFFGHLEPAKRAHLLDCLQQLAEHHRVTAPPID